VDGLVHLLDLRYTAGAVQTWEVYPQGLAAFDVHPNSNVFVASSSLGRSWRNQGVSLYTFTPTQQQPRPGQGDGSYPQPPVPILSTNFPSGISAPSRASSLPSTASLTQSVVAFHPADMFYALGTPDGTIRLQGCQFTKAKISTVQSDGLPSTNGHSGGTTYFDSGSSQIDFPTIRALKFLSKHRLERLDAIARELRGSHYDIISFQELWTSYDMMKDALTKLPYSKFWRTAAVGSGLAVFSKFPIIESHVYPYSLNGSPADLSGDWFAGKACASVVIVHPLLGEVQIFNTHFFAKGGEEGPEYWRAVRISNAWEMSKLVTAALGRGRHVIV
ncbi:phospholipase C type enzyme, partial [Serendipita sp. 399]